MEEEQMISRVVWWGGEDGTGEPKGREEGEKKNEAKENIGQRGSVPQACNLGFYFCYAQYAWGPKW